MSKSIIIGLTGPTGAGKSTASAAMQDCGCAVIDADAVAREVVQPGMPCVDELAKEFGEEIKKSDGGIHRSVLAKKAFASPGKTIRLNEITHPWIVDHIMKQVETFRASGIEIIVLDAPLLFESGIDKICDVIVAVTAPAELRLKRIMQRDGINQTAAKERMSAQKEETFYTQHADYVLQSGERTADLYRDAEELIEALREDMHVTQG